MMRFDEGLDAVKAVDPGGVVEIGAGGVLMPLAKPHQRLMRPRIAVIDRNLDDPRR